MILIVDDIAENLYSLKKILEINGFSVDTALSGEEALKKILKNPYFLIILDVQMPGMDGFKVAEIISGYSKTKDIPIIFLSAINTDKKYITKGYESGGMDYVTKPFDPDILLLKVKTFYRLYQQNQELTKIQATLMIEIETRKAAENIKDEFISIVSHELKTPLTSVIGYVQLLQRSLKKYEDQTVDKYLKRTHLQLGKLQNLIGDLLDISKIESGNVQFNKNPFDFNPMLQSAIEVVQHTQDCTIIQKNSVNAEVYGDEMRIEQVIINYLTNALKYSPACKEVHVESSITYQNEIYLRVKDFGIGIPKEMHANIFQKFYRVEESATRFQGLGIGLYISSEIIKHHGGTYGLVSTPGQGSEFYFKIPLVNPDN